MRLNAGPYGSNGYEAKKINDAGFLTNMSVLLAIALLFLISASSGAFALHNSSVTLIPEWSPADEQVSYTTTFCKISGSTINEVRIYKNYDGSILYSNFSCSQKSGWELGFINIYPACFYVANMSYDPIDVDGECQNFTFSAHTPAAGAQSCDLAWKFETRDVLDEWKFLFDNTSVDDKAPKITKVVGDPKVVIGDVTYITQNTPINLTAVDTGDCKLSGIKSCEYRYFVNGNPVKGWTAWDPNGFILKFPEDSNHTLEVRCIDNAGNEASFTEFDVVDTAPPNTTKTYGKPFFTDGTYDWITSGTPINLDASDPAPHPVGFDKLFWRNTILTIPDNECIAKCDFPGAGDWNAANATHTTVYKPEDSCHLIEFYSVDKLGNAEQTKRQCVFVDNKAPNITKSVGAPKINGSPQNADWIINSSTKITLACTDPAPHPVDHNIITYRYKVDNGTFGAWITYTSPFTFPEESKHTLEYNCSDALGNRGQTYTEVDIVDNTPPVINMTIGQPKVGSCPADGGNSCYIRDHVTPLTFNVTDAGIHKTGISRCEWSYTVDGQATDSGIEHEFPFTIIFPQDSIHVLKVTCYDSLNNSASISRTLVVDSKWPVTSKIYGQPFYTDGTSDWITSDTSITLNATDQEPHPVGVNATYWRNTLLGSDAPCYNPQLCAPSEVNVSYNLYAGPFKKPEESCHLIEFYSVDLLGNEEPLKWQCVFVDNSPPNVTKEIGNPKVIGKINITESESCGGDAGATQAASSTGSSIQTTDRSKYYEKYNAGEGFSTALSGVCDNASQPDQCAYLPSSSLPNFVKDTIAAEGGNMTSMNSGCGNVLILSSGNPANNGTTLSTDMGHPGCGANPDGFATHDCVNLSDFTPDAQSLVLAISSEWPEFYNTTFTDWMQISAVNVSVNISINSWNVNKTHNLTQYGPAMSGTRNLAALSNSSHVNLLVADSEDSIYDTALIVAPRACFGVIETPQLCGNGVIDFGEACDLGALNGKPNSTCSAECEIVTPEKENESVCGNGILEQPPAFPNSTEQCDLGAENGQEGSGCSADCKIANATNCTSSRIYTLDADFDEGTLVGLEHTTIHNQLQINPGVTSTYPIMWIANAGEDTVSKWDTNTDKELARYHTWFGTSNHGAWDGAAPSRTAVDTDGNVYVANRHFDGLPADVFKILANDYIDRNGNGVMDTSIDANNDGTISPSEMLLMTDNNSNNKIDPNEIVDERVAWVATVGPMGCTGRSIAIDMNNNIWLGCYSTQQYYKISSINGSLLGGPYSVAPHTPYGALVDKYGILWGASLSNNLLRLDTNNPSNWTLFYHGGSNYGIALGYNGTEKTQVYLGMDSPYYQFDSATNTFSTPGALAFGSLGIAVDQNGNIVVGNSGTGGVAKFYPNGSVIWNAPAQVASEARGTVVDSNNDVWIIHVNANKLSKFRGTDGAPLGVFNSGLHPYTYSDATGLGLKASVAAGSWNVIYDGGANDTALGPVSWSANVPANTTLTVKVRSSNDKVSWSVWETIVNGTAFATTPKGRYLEVQVSMKGTASSSPVLYDLTVQGGCPQQTCLVNVTVDAAYITQQTPITITCKDVLPHPVDHSSMFYRYRLSDDCKNWGAWTNWTDPQGSDDLEKTIHFAEDSCHELEYYCVDALGNRREVSREIDIVDTKPPVISKTIVGPVFVAGNKTYIDGVTKIHVEAKDPEPHPVNNVTCDWSYTVRENDSATGGGAGIAQPFDINFPEESTHDLKIVCRDALGNAVQDNETFIVDKTPPVTTKALYGPQYPADAEHAKYPRWISSKTNVTLAVDDAGPHKSGVKATYWRNTIVADANCRNETLCESAPGSGAWNTYTGTFNKPEQSCHLIEYYSVDNVNKTEKVKKQCVFVDNTPPTPEKIVGEPAEKWDGMDAKYYNISGRCWSGKENSIECWKVTTLTPITMSCVDPAPHPVDHSTIAFNVNFDGSDKTMDYCKEFGGEYNISGDGFCAIDSENQITFLFREESEHNLQFYCTDALGNKGPIDEEKFKVEGTSFNITVNKKWNLISVPFTLLNDSMHKVFDSKAGKILSVWTYDAVTNQWYVYTPDGVENDNMNSMLPGWGYWVLAGNDTQLLIGGSLFSPAKTPPSKQIVRGWNLIGYWGTEGMSGYYGPAGNGKPASCELYSLGDSLWSKEYSSLWTYWEPYNPNQWIPYPQSKRMDPGAGYWVHTNQEGEYVVPTDCGNLIA